MPCERLDHLYGVFKLIVFVLQPTALLFWFSFTASSQPCFPDTAAVLSEKAVNTHCTLPALQQAAITQNSSSLLNIAEHLAAQEPDFFSYIHQNRLVDACGTDKETPYKTLQLDLNMSYVT